MVEEVAAKRLEELVARRVEEELERRRDEIEAEVLRRVEEAKRLMEQQMLEELQEKRRQQEEDRRKQEVELPSLGFTGDFLLALLSLICRSSSVQISREGLLYSAPNITFSMGCSNGLLLWATVVDSLPEPERLRAFYQRIREGNARMGVSGWEDEIHYFFKYIFTIGEVKDNFYDMIAQLLVAVLAFFCQKIHVGQCRKISSAIKSGVTGLAYSYCLYAQ